MNMITTIFSYIMMLFIGVIVVMIFIQSNKELWNEIGKDITNDIKNRFKATRLGMWIINKRNGVTILSDREYDNLLKSGKIKFIDIEVE